MPHDANLQQYRRDCRRPYVLGIDHVAFAAHDLEATCAQTIGLFVGPCPKLPFIRRSATRASLTAGDWRKPMPQSEQFEALILGSGFGGKLLAWHLAQSG